jgi:hypothetical protein
MKRVSRSSDNKNYPIVMVKHSNFQSSSQTSSSSTTTNLAKDERLELLDISKGLIEILQVSGFTIESILDYGPSKIAEKLGIDDYVAQIIFNETTKSSN